MDREYIHGSMANAIVASGKKEKCKE